MFPHIHDKWDTQRNSLIVNNYTWYLERNYTAIPQFSLYVHECGLNPHSFPFLYAYSRLGFEQQLSLQVDYYKRADIAIISEYSYGMLCAEI